MAREGDAVVEVLLRPDVVHRVSDCDGVCVLGLPKDPRYAVQRSKVRVGWQSDPFVARLELLLQLRHFLLEPDLAQQETDNGPPVGVQVAVGVPLAVHYGQLVHDGVLVLPSDGHPRAHAQRHPVAVHEQPTVDVETAARDQRPVLRMLEMVAVVCGRPRRRPFYIRSPDALGKMSVCRDGHFRPPIR